MHGTTTRWRTAVGRGMAVLLILVTVTGTLAVADSAHAFDLTGTWEGSYKCKGSFGGQKDSSEDALVASITQTETAVGADILFGANPFRYNGLAVANAAKPDKGDLALVICGSDDDLSAGAYDEMGRLSVITKPAKGTGSIKGTSNYSSTNPVQVYTCKWKLKRTSTVDPAVATACP